MRDDKSPFEKVEEYGRTVLRLRGKEDQRIVVEKDKIPIILEAIAEGWDIDIQYAVIDGGLDIRLIADQLDKDDKGNSIIKGNVGIYNSEIRGDAYFRSATFSGDAYFSYATFSGDAYFRSDTFSGDAYFSYATFSGGAYFSYATFSGDAYFGSATFSSYTYFSKVVFAKDAKFFYSFFGKYVNLDEAIFDKTPPESFDSIGDAYVRSSVKGGHFFFQKAGEGYLVGEPDYPSASNSFRNAKVEYEKEGRYDEASRMYVEEMKCVKKSSGWWKNKRYWFWELTCNYGESWGRFILWVFGIIAIFAVIYAPSRWGIIEFANHPYMLDKSFCDKLWTALYISISTFASFGNLEPVSKLGKFLVSFELLLGYLTFGVLITLVARKITRV